jgi:hypothetical protein
MSLNKNKPVGHDRTKEEKMKDLKKETTPSGKSLSDHKSPADINEAPNQQRMKTDGLTSSQNIGRNQNLDDDDTKGLNNSTVLK